MALIQHQMTTIRDHWDEVCDAAELSRGERELLWNGAFFKPYAFEGLPELQEA